MGTNYYIRYKICDCCNRYDEFHIGKSSAGWQFSFHAIDHTEEILMKHLDPKNMLADDEEYLDIKNFQDWKSFIEKYVTQYKTAKIYNEYDEEVEVLELLELIEVKREEKRNHAEYMKTEYKYVYHAGQDYKDDEGYSFSKGEFS